ncbi:hypothetical protein [Actinoplanes sp. GCM10030250]|uniref:hypothetical protein n=1 Tax=Actinoplanes sp. GCM10030250 TaxID=3273376 RepID=UPI0036075A99
MDGALSQPVHHHCYELGITSTEPALYRCELLEIVALLDAAEASYERNKLARDIIMDFVHRVALPLSQEDRLIRIPE